MRLEKIAQLVNLLAVIPGVYAAYAVLHSQTPHSQQLQYAGGATHGRGLLLSFLAFCACVAIGAVLNSLVWLRKGSLPVAVIGMPPPTEQAIESRVFVDVQPAYLAGLLEGHSSTKARMLMQAYLGKWIRVSGKVDEVRATNTFLRLSFQDENGEENPPLTLMYFTKQWADRLSVLRKGDPVTVVGRIEGVEGRVVSLDQCELVAADQVRFPNIAS